jgi:flagellar protein FlaG
VVRAVEQLDALAKQFNRRLRFNIDQDTGELYVEVYDSQTHQVIGTIPPEEVMELRQKLRHMTGLLLDRTG